MPVATTYPGVYIEEIPSGVRTIVGVSTSVAAFVDFFRRGAMNRAIQIFSFGDFEREFGGLDQRSEGSYAIQQFFLNGGTEAHVVRVASGTPNAASVFALDGVGGAAANALELTAINEGVWGNNLRVIVERVSSSIAPNDRINLFVLELGTSNGQTVVLRQETFRNLTMSALLPSPPNPPGTPDPNFVETVVNSASQLIQVDALGTNRPAASGTLSGPFPTPFATINPPAVNEPLRMNVSFTVGALPVVTRDTSLGQGAILTLDEAAARLEAGIRAANPTSPAWAQTTVRVVDNRLQVIAGPSASNAVITFVGAPAAPPLGADATTVVSLQLTGPAVAPNVAQYQLGATTPTAGQGGGGTGNDGTPPDASALLGSEGVDPPTGMFALNKADLFNILCLPRIARVTGTNAFAPGQVDTVISTATAYCERRRAFFILDTPSDVLNIAQIKTWMTAKGSLRHRNLALYFPRVQFADPLDDYRLRSFGGSGTMAGVYARTDVQRGIWKAPAGTDATLRNVTQFDFKMSDAENGAINPLGINALRAFDVYGNIAWGARTLVGSDQLASEWKYVPVRRLALYLEESLYRGTQWVVFEPNDEPLWAQIRLNVGAFMQGLFLQGAFQGTTPREAYLVKCDKETTTQNDINLGVVNIVVGFAPLKPAEFVIIEIQQLAGQIQT